MNHPYKFGKLAPKADSRTLKLRSVLRAPVKLPAEYSFDAKHPGCPLRMYLNDTYGDCVMAGRANQQTRFELMETGKVIQITDAEVKREYFKETGGEDAGLNMLDAMKAWRHGWTAAGKKFTIDAFATINWKDHEEVKQAIYAKVGVPIGVMLPENDAAMNEFYHGKPWTSIKERPDRKSGHCVYLIGWTKLGPICLTWAHRQSLSWAWLDRYGDEAFAVIDSLDRPSVKKLVNHERTRWYLEQVAA